MFTIACCLVVGLGLSSGLDLLASKRPTSLYRCQMYTSIYRILNILIVVYFVEGVMKTGLVMVN